MSVEYHSDGPATHEPLLPGAMMDGLVRSNPRCALQIDASALNPDLIPGDRILAELLIYRDRIEGLEHASLASICTADW